MKRTCLWILAIVLATAGTGFASSAPKPSIIIELPETYTVQSKATEQIHLGDLATKIQAPDEETKQKYASLVVLDAPLPGTHTRLPNHYIIQSIRRAGLNFTQVKFTGERVVIVYGYGKSFNIKNAIAKIKSQVVEESGWDEKELVFRILSTPRQSLWIPPQDYELVVKKVSPVLYGTIRFEVRIFIDNILYKSFPIIASISHRRVAFMPTRNLKRGEIIGPTDVREVVQYFDKELVDRQAVDEKKEIVGRKCRTDLRKSDLIKWNNLDVNYVVQRGDAVKMFFNQGGLTIQTLGKSMSRGAVGDVISIKLEATKHIVKAKVIQRGLVEMLSS